MGREAEQRQAILHPSINALASCDCTCKAMAALMHNGYGILGII